MYNKDILLTILTFVDPNDIRVLFTLFRLNKLCYGIQTSILFWRLYSKKYIGTEYNTKEEFLLHYNTEIAQTSLTNSEQLPSFHSTIYHLTMTVGKGHISSIKYSPESRGETHTYLVTQIGDIFVPIHKNRIYPYRYRFKMKLEPKKRSFFLSREQQIEYLRQDKSLDSIPDNRLLQIYYVKITYTFRLDGSVRNAELLDDNVYKFIELFSGRVIK